MKDLIALLIFLAVAACSIYMAVSRRIELGLTIVLLCFSIISGFAIANYDLIERLKWGDWLEVETAKREIHATKENALEEIKSEVKDQKESIKLLIADANHTRDKIERQKDSLKNLIVAATDLQSKIENQKEKIIQLNKNAENTRDEIEELNDAASRIALILVRATYFTVETKNEFGTERAQIAIKEILNDLNAILPMVIPNEKERAEWIRKLQNTLPPRD